MEDFKNSVAHLDVDVSTSIGYTAVVGENFYRFLYVSQKTGLAPTLLTKDTYVDVLKTLLAGDEANIKLATKNIASLYEYATSARGYIISAADYEAYKYKGYFVYLESEFLSRMVDQYNPVTPDPLDNPQEQGWYEEDGAGGYVLTEDETVDETKTYYEKVQVFGGVELTPDAKANFDLIDTVLDKDFSQVVTDIAIPFTATDKVQAVADFEDTLNEYNMKVWAFLRGANEDYTWDKSGDGNVSVGLSPALYQLGRTLGFTNSTGRPIGNSCDSVACAQADVLITRSTSSEELVNPDAKLISWAQTAKLQYFKTIGNGTGTMDCWGGWTTKNSCVCADWIVAYANYMTKVDCATIISGMNVFKDANTYAKCVSAMDANVQPFVALGRITAYSVTAPAFGAVKSDGHSIVIPDAWEGTYVDNLRHVKIQGALTVEA